MQQPLTLKRIDVMEPGRDGRVLLSFADSVLTRSVARPGPNIAIAERLKVAGGTRAVVYVWVPVDARSAPAALVNRVTIEMGTGDSLRTAMLDSPAVPVTAASGSPAMARRTSRGIVAR